MRAVSEVVIIRNRRSQETTEEHTEMEKKKKKELDSHNTRVQMLTLSLTILAEAGEPA